jgi:hypothetical protein
VLTNANIYLINEAPSPNFLYSVICSVFHFSSIDNDLYILPDPPPMDLEPLDHHPTPVMSLPPPNLPHPPQTNTSDPSLNPSEEDLLRYFEAMQLSSRAAQSSTWQFEETMATQFNVLMKVAEPQGTAREVTTHSIHLELQKA